MAADPFTTRFEGPAPEVEVTRDMLRRGVWGAPLLVGICAAIWGGAGALSSLFAIGLVMGNFALSAAIIAWTSRISIAMLLGSVLFGYLMRLGIIFLAVYLVHDMGWVSLPALGTSIIVTHLGLLIWELRFVSMSLAYPGLKPVKSKSTSN
jgi:hypothetical protein